MRAVTQAASDTRRVAPARGGGPSRAGRREWGVESRELLACWVGLKLTPGRPQVCSPPRTRDHARPPAAGARQSHPGTEPAASGAGAGLSKCAASSTQGTWLRKPRSLCGTHSCAGLAAEALAVHGQVLEVQLFDGEHLGVAQGTQDRRRRLPRHLSRLARGEGAVFLARPPWHARSQSPHAHRGRDTVMGPAHARVPRATSGA